jgi:glycerol-3-phosphate dehydrogenase
MTAIDGPWDALVVGGGATGSGVLRDLARRGLRTLLIERGDLGAGTSGRYHGLLHSGARYAARDPGAARDCISENRILRQVARFAIEDTGGYFVATPDDPDDYVDRFAADCQATGVDCQEVATGELFRAVPAINRGIRRAFSVPDATLEPWVLIEANVRDAEARGSRALRYHKLLGFEKAGERITAARIADVRSGTVERVAAGQFVSAAGAWAGQVVGLAGAKLDMSPGKGTMLIFNQRMTDAVINRCHQPGDGDIICPVGMVAILGTTDITVADPDDWEITRAEVEELLTEGEKLFPGLRGMRLLRAYGGVRPLYDPAAAGADSRDVTRSHVVIDHASRDGIANFTSIVGGKLTTHRLMAEHTADRVCRKIGLNVACTTADDALPGGEHGSQYWWIGRRLADHERAGGGDADLICECELVTRAMLDAVLDHQPDASLDDVRRLTRLGMGPCQGGFCTFRAAGVVAERGARVTTGDSRGGRSEPDPQLGDRAMTDFLRERYRGTRPVAHGRQLQEALFVAGLYWGTLGVGSILANADTPPGGGPATNGRQTESAPATPPRAEPKRAVG